MKRTIAQVAVDTPLSHLDKPFDYEVPSPMLPDLHLGVRVQVRFAGTTRSGFVVGISDESEADGLQPLKKIISPEPVLHTEIIALVREVADHYAGSFADVVRLAVPPRHRATELATPAKYCDPLLPLADQDRLDALDAYPFGERYCELLRQGEHPRVAWSAIPAFDHDPIMGLLQAAQATLESGRGVLILVPDGSDLKRLEIACTAVFGRGSFVALAASCGPATRYRRFLAASRGQVRFVIGTRAAAFVPVSNLGLIALWDDGDDSYVEARAPYPHTREVAVLRAHQEKAALLFGAYSRTPEIQALVEKQWLVPIALPPAQVRAVSPRLTICADRSDAISGDSGVKATRIPSDAFRLIRAGLVEGAVLCQVPRAGYLPGVQCSKCRTTACCSRCQQPLAAISDTSLLAADSKPRRSPPSGAMATKSAMRSSMMGGAGEGASGDAESKSRQLVLRCPWCGALPNWRCGECGNGTYRARFVGVSRTAEEFGKAFPGVRIIHSWSEHHIAEVADEPAIVLATPGMEPLPATGYAAAVLLDTEIMLSRPDLRVAQEALRRWLAVVSLVRSGTSGGKVLAIGNPAERAIGALSRLDAVGFAERELADRVAAGFPPGAKLLTLEGESAALFAVRSQLQIAATGDTDSRDDWKVSRDGLVCIPESTQIIGPFPLTDSEEVFRLSLRCPLSEGKQLVRAIKTILSVRTARKEQSVRVRVDPQVVG